MGSQESDVSMGDYTLTDSQVDAAAKAFLAAHPDDDRVGDALATGPANPPADKPANPPADKPADKPAADETGKPGADETSGLFNDDDDDDDDDEPDEADNLVEECKKEGFKCHIKAAMLWLENIDTLQRGGWGSIKELADEETNKINKGHVDAALKFIKDEEADAELRAQQGPNTQEDNFFSQEDDEEKDPDEVGGEKELMDMTAADMFALIAKKTAEMEVKIEEDRVGPVRMKLQDFAAAATPSDKAERKVAVSKMQTIIGFEIFKNLSITELELLSGICTANIDKIKLPGIISGLDTELKTLKTAHKEVKARESEEKDNEKLKKDVEKNKRKMQAESSSSSSKPKRARGK